MQSKVLRRNRWAFSLGSIGRDMAAAGLFMNYLLSYAILTKGLSTQRLMVLAAIMLGARIIETLLDPVMGSIIDATHSRWGKFKPWIALGALGTAVIVVLSFSNHWQGSTYIVAFGILYLLYDLFFTMNDIAYWGMLPALSRTSGERNRIASLSALMAGLGGLISNAFVPLLTVGGLALGGSAVTAYSRVALIFATALIISQAITLIFVREPHRAVQRQPVRLGIWAVVDVLKRNGELRWNAVILLLCMMTNTLGTTVMPFYFYFTLGYSGVWPLIYAVVGQVVVGIVYLFFGRISDRFTRKMLARWATYMSVCGYLLLLLAAAVVPNAAPVVKVFVMALLNVLPAIGTGLYLLIMEINIANCVEYDELLTGVRSEGIIYSVRPLVNKFGLGLGQFAAMLTYAVSGTLAINQRIARLEQAAAGRRLSEADKLKRIATLTGSVPATGQWLLLLVAVLVPLFGTCLMWTLYRRKLHLNESRFAAIGDKLAKRTKQV